LTVIAAVTDVGPALTTGPLRELLSNRMATTRTCLVGMSEARLGLGGVPSRSLLQRLDTSHARILPGY